MTTTTTTRDETTMTSTTPTPVVVAGNRTVHAGRRIGAYPSGNARYAKVCGTSRNDRHEPFPVADGTPITCKRCAAKLAARA